MREPGFYSAVMATFFALVFLVWSFMNSLEGYPPLNFYDDLILLLMLFFGFLHYFQSKRYKKLK